MAAPIVESPIGAATPAVAAADGGVIKPNLDEGAASGSASAGLPGTRADLPPYPPRL